MDNNYIGYVNFQDPSVQQHVITFTQVFLDVLYNIPMKWEPSGTINDLCEARVITLPEVGLLMKGVHFPPPDTSNPHPDTAIWDRWVDLDSLNARDVLKSMLPTVSSKALTCALALALAQLHMQINLVPIVRVCVCVCKEYAKAWWWPPL